MTTMNTTDQPRAVACIRFVRPLDDVFPFEYQGGGYFRRKGIPKGVTAEILHGQQAIEYLYNELTKDSATEPNQVFKNEAELEESRREALI